MIQINSRSKAAPAFIPDFSDPLGLLVHCHGRIEGQLKALERCVPLLQAGDPESLEAARGAITVAQAHFEGPGRLHTADEEESLFPRMRAHPDAASTGVLQALEQLEEQHRVAERSHAALDAIVRRLLATDTPKPEQIETFDLCVGELVGLYVPHIAMENEVVFPAAGRLLSSEDLAAIGNEMRARRGR